jgi:phosphoribosylformylglycinamidine synthase
VLPATDPEVAAATAAAVRSAVRSSSVWGAHDVADGGVALAVAEMAAASGVGATLARMADHADLFSESPGRVLLCVDPDGLAELEAEIAEAGVPSVRIGVAGGDALRVKDLLDLPIEDLRRAWEGTLDSALGGGTTQG